MKDLAIIDGQTGRRLSIEKKAVIEDKVKAMSDPEKSDLLTFVNYLRKESGKWETAIKDAIKNSELDFVYDETKDKEYAMFGEHRVTRSKRSTIDWKAFAQDHPELYEKIKEKYTKETKSVRI